MGAGASAFKTDDQGSLGSTQSEKSLALLLMIDIASSELLKGGRGGARGHYGEMPCVSCHFSSFNFRSQSFQLHSHPLDL